MGCAHSRFTVLFEGPFWVGLYEREEDGLYTVCKVTFGAEPSGAEVYAFLCTHWHSLRFGQALPRGMRSAPFCASPAKAQGKAQGALASLCLFIARAFA